MHWTVPSTFCTMQQNYSRYHQAKQNWKVRPANSALQKLNHYHLPKCWKLIEVLVAKTTKDSTNWIIMDTWYDGWKVLMEKKNLHESICIKEGSTSWKKIHMEYMYKRREHYYFAAVEIMECHWKTNTTSWRSAVKDKQSNSRSLTDLGVLLLFGYRTEIFPFPERTPHQNGRETFNHEEKEKKNTCPSWR
jgi:hypothetical protein